MRSVYHHLYSATMTPLHLTEDERKRAIRSWLCKDCGEPRPGPYGVDVQIQEDMPPDDVLSFVFGCGVPVARKDFIWRLGEDLIAKDLLIGRVLGPHGRQFGDLVTFRGRCRVLVRGVKSVTYRVCPSCGSQLYFSMAGERYLYPEPPQDIAIWQSNLWGLILPEELCQGRGMEGHVGIQHEVLSVPVNPKDGLSIPPPRRVGSSSQDERRTL